MRQEGKFSCRRQFLKRWSKEATAVKMMRQEAGRTEGSLLRDGWDARARSVWRSGMVEDSVKVWAHPGSAAGAEPGSIYGTHAGILSPAAHPVHILFNDI